MMKQKILVFGMTDNPGGVESVIMNYYRNIDRNRIQFDFLCNYNKIAYEKEIKSLGGNIFYITARKANFIKFRKDLYNFMSKHAKEYSVFWVNVCSLVNIDYLVCAKKYGIPKIIIHCHNSDNDGNNIKKIIHSFNRMRLKKYATDFWSCSDKASPWFFTPEIIKSSNYRVIPNAIDIEKFKKNRLVRSAMRKHYNLENKIVIGNVGRFHFQKNHKFIIDVFEQLVKRDKNYRLILVGQGSMEEEIVQKVKSKGLENEVIFCGVQSEVNNFYQMMDCFLFPSLFEGLGIAALEAQACSLPCVLSNRVPSIVKVNDNVVFLSLDDELSAWVNAIEYLVHLDTNVFENKMEKSIYNIKTQVDFFERIIVK